MAPMRSDLWWPMVWLSLAGLSAFVAHCLWCQWRVLRLSQSQAVHSPQQQAHQELALDVFQANSFSNSATEPGFAAMGSEHARASLPTSPQTLGLAASEMVNQSVSHAAHHRLKDFSHIVDLHALTAQKKPIVIESYPIDPSDDEHEPTAAQSSARLEAPPSQTVSLNVSQGMPHPQLHWTVRLIWDQDPGEQLLNQLLQAYPCPMALPVSWFADTQHQHAVRVAWQVVNRKERASTEQMLGFVQWCETLADAGAARVELVQAMSSWDAFVDEAHALIIGLDSVILLKLSVPLAQLDLFAQSLLAARFTQQQEHWVYQEHEQGARVCLERLWQQDLAVISNPQTTLARAHVSSNDGGVGTPSEQPHSANAYFQLLLDIPHLDGLEARKVYMRLRAIARASAAIMQSAQGAHLSEGMLDRYSRELMLKQEALSKADLMPGSWLTRTVFNPQLTLSQDLNPSPQYPSQR